MAGTLTEPPLPRLPETMPGLWPLYGEATGVLEERFFLLQQGVTHLSRQNRDWWFLASDERLSEDHAILRCSTPDRPVLLLARRTKNGTYLNGRAVVPDAPVALVDGDLLRVGSTLLLFRREPSIQEQPECPGLIGRSTTLGRLKKKIVKVARSGDSVLLLGETGTGKELSAQAIHAHSGLPVLRAVNSAELSSSLAESLLFGHERGAFTGAERAGLGHFREADGGTLFLDELGELSLEVQAKLLRAVEQQQVMPLGARAPVRVKVRLIAATHLDLQEAVRERRFRADLLQRLAQRTLRLPPLRERREDIPLLLEHFLGKRRLRARLMEHLVLRDYVQGNVRELYNVARQLHSESGTAGWLDLCDLEEEPGPATEERMMHEDPDSATWSGAASSESAGGAASESAAQDGAPSTSSTGPAADDGWKTRRLETISREEWEGLLRRTRGNITKLAQLLGCDPHTIRRQLKRHGLDAQAYR